MITLNFVFVFLVSVSGFFPSFYPPSCGIGSETAGDGVRVFSMGGVSAGVPDSNSVSGANPAASAWAANTALSWGTKVRATEDASWSMAADYPNISLIVPMPLRLQFSAFLNNRSRINTKDPIIFENGTGSVNWTGGTGESYLGITTRVSDYLAFSLGGKCFYGSAMGDAVTSAGSSNNSIPMSSNYMEDISFSPAWGPVLGVFMNTKHLSAGFSILTDRSGILSVDRHYMGDSFADTTLHYSVPGELTAGISAHLHPRILAGVDYFARKKLKLLGSTTAAGHSISSGLEYFPSSDLRVRGGFRTIDGLWRDGALRYSAGVGYLISGAKAAIDIGVSHETWGIDESETVFFASIRTSENWLGQ